MDNTTELQRLEQFVDKLLNKYNQLKADYLSLQETLLFLLTFSPIALFSLYISWSSALNARFNSRGESDFQNKLLSALRFQFGGHHEKKD